MIINLTFWIIISASFIGVSIYYFGEVSRGYLREVIQFIGGTINIVAMFLSIFILNWKTFLLLVLIDFTFMSFVSAFLVEFITKKRIK